MKTVFLLASLVLCPALQAAQISLDDDSVHSNKDGVKWRVRDAMKMVNDTLIVDFSKLTGGQPVNIPEERIEKAVEAVVRDSHGKGKEAPKLSELANAEWMVSEHNAVNHPVEAVFLNKKFVKSTVGLDPEALAKGKVEHKEGLTEVGGHLYRARVDYTAAAYKPKLVGLKELHAQYAPNVPLKSFLFMVDGVLLTSDLNAFRFDADYIDTVEVVLPTADAADERAKVYQSVGLMQIYTKGFRPTRTALVTLHSAEGDSLVLKPYSQKEVNRSGRRFLLNKREVGTFVGLDLEILADDSDLRIYSDKKVVDIESFDYDPRLISLRNIRGRFLNTTAANPIFFLNDVMITGNLRNISLDADYIQNIRLFTSTEIEALDGGVVVWGRHDQPVSVVRIYMSTPVMRQKAKDYARIQ